MTDLTKKTSSIAKNIPALFQELASPCTSSLSSPFITGIDVLTDYQGYMFIDKMIGGFFALNILALFCFWIFRLRRKMMAGKTFGLGVNYLSVFSDGQAISVRTYNPALFYRIRYLLLPS